jgi:hypothetical protein
VAKRKKEGVKVVWRDAKGRAEIVTLAEFLRRSAAAAEELKRRLDPAERALDQFRKKGKASNGNLLAVLAEAKYGSTADQTYVAIRYELIDVIAESLAGPHKWQRSQVKAKKGRAASVHARWDQEARKIWEDHPSWSASAVALLIARRLGGNADTIRKRIKRLKK